MVITSDAFVRRHRQCLSGPDKLAEGDMLKFPGTRRRLSPQTVWHVRPPVRSTHDGWYHAGPCQWLCPFGGTSSSGMSLVDGNYFLWNWACFVDFGDMPLWVVFTIVPFRACFRTQGGWLSLASLEVCTGFPTESLRPVEPNAHL